MIGDDRMTGRLLSIFVAERSRAKPEEVLEARVVAGKGIVGDRCYREEGVAAPEQELTLVESEQVDGFNRRTGLGAPYWKMRRNLLTSDVDLAALVGRRFRIGDVEAEGLELCEPCATLGRLLSTQDVAPKRVIAELLHRAGLRARIVTSGVVRAGDSIGLSGWAA